MFNFELYKEGLRKTKVWGVLFGIAMLMGALIQPISHLASHADNLRRAAEHDWWHVEPILRIRGLDAFVLMPLTFIIAVPFLTLTIFAFLNGRNSSDFYHAIPHKRETLFISFLGSILTWSLGILFVTTTISTGIYASSAYTNVYFGSIFMTLLSTVVISILVMSGITLAMAATGTTLSNIAAAGLILFLPRLLIWMFVALVEARTPVIGFSNFAQWVMPRFNLLFGFFDNQFHFGERLSGATIYTFLLGLIYLVLAGYFFKKRHSELASNPGSKWSQPIIRVALTFALTLPALTMILQYEDIRTVFIFYMIAFVGYFAYEVFTTRKIHSLKKMLPGLGIVILLNIVFGVGIGIASRYFMREIDVARITSAVVDLEANWGGNYVVLNMGQIEITDAQVARLLGEELNEFIDGDIRPGNSHRVAVMFTFDDGRQMNRVLHLTLYSEFVAWLMSYEPYRELHLRIPQNFHSAWSWPGDLTQAQIQSVLNVLAVELQEIDFKDWYLLVGTFSHRGWFWDDATSDWADFEMPVEHGNIELSGMVGNQSYWSHFPITELTPRTLALYLSYVNDADGYEGD